MFKHFFKKKNELSWQVPITGEIKPITEVPDKVFAKKMMGDGFCVDPTDKKVYAPTDGEIISVFPTKHAIGIKAETGDEILIHFGINTVNLNGEGFDVHVKAGDIVKAGDLLLEVDMDYVKGKIASLITAVIITNLEGKTVDISKFGKAQQGEVINLEIINA